jgi:hypothetical protein
MRCFTAHHTHCIRRYAYYRVFHLKRNHNYHGIISFGDINITRQTNCFLVFICLEELIEQLYSRCWKRPPPSRRQAFALFSACVSCDFAECFGSNFISRCIVGLRLSLPCSNRSRLLLSGWCGRWLSFKACQLRKGGCHNVVHILHNWLR